MEMRTACYCVVELLRRRESARERSYKVIGKGLGNMLRCTMNEPRLGL